MCRLYGVHSGKPIRIHRAFAALRAQSHEHKDGWGVVRFDGEKAETELGLDPAHRSSRFLELSLVATRSMVAHIRLASVGGVCRTNAHPFVAEGWAFTHNGTIQRFAERKEKFEALLTPDRRAAIVGQTDSERCFQLFLQYLDGGSTIRQVAHALARVMRDVRETFDEKDTKQSATNFLVSNGSVMVASRRGRTLYTAEADGAQMIASEPLWHDHEWHEVPEEHIVGVGPSLELERLSCRDLLS
jgi:glutamine amidotransferase